MSKNPFAQHRYLQTLHSRYYRLPTVLWNYIWTYDNRYRIAFKDCIFEFLRNVNHTRLIDRIQYDFNLYTVYLQVIQVRDPGRPTMSYANYIRTKIRIFGIPEFDIHLNYNSSRKYSGEVVTNALQN